LRRRNRPVSERALAITKIALAKTPASNLAPGDIPTALVRQQLREAEALSSTHLLPLPEEIEAFLSADKPVANSRGKLHWPTRKSGRPRDEQMTAARIAVTEHWLQFLEGGGDPDSKSSAEWYEELKAVAGEAHGRIVTGQRPRRLEEYVRRFLEKHEVNPPRRERRRPGGAWRRQTKPRLGGIGRRQLKPRTRGVGRHRGR
jgi:hypothetical protein